MKRILFTYFRHFLPLTVRLMRLVVNNRNRPEVHIIEINDNWKVAKSFLLLKIEIKNLIFLRINDAILPVFRDDPISLNIPLVKKSKVLTLRGIGAFKSSQILELSLGEIASVQVKSLRLTRTGSWKGIKPRWNKISLNNSRPNIRLSSMVGTRTFSPVLKAPIKLNRNNIELQNTNPIIDLDCEISLDMKELYVELKKNNHE